MKKMRKCWNCTKRTLIQIHLVDKCLILFMFVLLAQSAFSLFFHGASSKEAHNIDVIVRTSSASIFGYFLSANFIRRSPGSKSKPPPDVHISEVKPDTEQLPPCPYDQETCPISEENPKKESHDNDAGKLQIIAATGIGLFCLLVLVIQRDVANADAVFINTASTTATVAQFRDFVSGCVGFLIGCPTNRTPRDK